MNTAVTTHQLSKRYEKQEGWRLARTTPVTAVSDITLSIPNGELFGLLGPNGAGKTTLVKMLCTLIAPSSGSATIAGYDLRQASAIRATVGLVVSDERSFYWRLSARRNLEFFAAMYGLYGRSAQTRVNQVLTDVDLLDVAQRRFGNFSSGMRQRLAIARALLHQPQILFLDEPSRSLDPTATANLHDLIRRLMAQRQMTVFLITHDLAEAEALCDRVALMHQGRVQVIGQPGELRRQLRPQRLYQVQVGVVTPAVVSSLQAICPNLTYQGQHVIFRAAEEEGVLTAVFDHLRAQQIPIHSIEAIPPSLEEVFAHYTKGAG